RRTARRTGFGERREVLLLRKTRVAAVNMDVDRARKDVQARAVDGLFAAAKTGIHTGDHAVADHDVNLPRALLGVDGPVLEEELSQVGGLARETAASRECPLPECSLRRLLLCPAPRRGGSPR